jgi:two-component system, OmpR family, sensor histidine kinase KdpD
MVGAHWLGYAVALGSVALVSLLIGLVLGHVSLANSSMLYLLAVLATAVAGGRGPAVFASVVAFLVFDWFFVWPLHTFTVSDPNEWVSLLFFLLTAIVTGQLAADQRQRAAQARQREREAVVLYDVVRLMGERDLDEALAAVAERLRAELRLVAVAVELDDERGQRSRVAAGDPEALERLRAGAAKPAHLLHAGRDAADRPGRWVRLVPAGAPQRSSGIAGPGRPDPAAGGDRVDLVPIRAEDRRLGSLLLVSASADPPFDPVADRLLTAAAGQLGLAVERAQLRREATEAEILRRTDALRRALLNAVSHDLRTPLASILASAGSLRQPDVAWSEAERQEFLAAIEDEAKRLNRIVGNLLDLSRIEGGSLRPEKAWYDLGALVDDVLGRLRPLTARHRLVVDVAPDLPAVPLDYVEIDQVLSNLVENATKYTPAGTEIAVTARRDNGIVHLSVADRGPGIPPEALPHLFDPFYRVADGTPRPAGLGLGLAVARGLVEAHGGHLRADNRPGGGALFTLTLPLGPPARA